MGSAMGSAMVRRVMVASCLHGCVGGFYAPWPEREIKFCRLNRFKSMEALIRGHYTSS